MMNRRAFLNTSAGFLAVATAPGIFRVNANTRSKTTKIRFREYQRERSVGKVNIVSPDDGFYIHTFFDVCPFSPSQRYLAVNKLPYQDRDARYGDVTDICVIDLEEETIETIYSTKGWGYQLGANLNWGVTDRYLYTNDIIGNQAVCVQIDLRSKQHTAFAGPMYHIAPDESAVVGFPLDLINNTQMGYGVPAFRKVNGINGAPSDEGLWKTDLSSNDSKLLVSLQDAVAQTDNPDFFEAGNCYFFHTKYNPQGTKLFQVLRCLFPNDKTRKGRNPALLTFNSDGSSIHQTISWKQWSYGGNHPNWHPDGNHIVMNLVPTWLGDNNMRFCIFRHDGSDFRILSDKHLGSGHPSLNADSSYLLSDYYVGEYKSIGEKESPIRLIQLNGGEEAAICTVQTDLNIQDSTFRVDPHPVWSRDFKKVCFNGAPAGRRQVFVADLSEVI